MRRVADSWSWLTGYSAVLKRVDEKAKCSSRSQFCKHAIDALIGWVVVSVVLGYWSSAVIGKEVRLVSEQLELLISSLEKLIEWLMGNPAGLKLNKPLNHTLGHFFRYHIYLWRTYLTFLNPALEVGLVLLRWISLLGVSLQIALVVDFVAVFTLHIYCFHVYAASGAGKTTLLNTLVQRNLKGLEVNGTVCVNGEQIGRAITSLSAYVQQDDLFIGTLTVREHLVFQATLRLPRSMSASAKRQRVDEVIAELGLRKCQHTRIGVPGVRRGISGGETKRLAFASEILTNPSVLFCDEPTTGLDSFMAESVVNVLRRLAHSGKTIVCTIHQPASEIYALFDRVLYLADGRTAFFGRNEIALDFFSTVGYQCPQDFNPADFLIQTLAVLPHEEEECRQRVSAICDQYDRSEHALSVEKMVRESVSSGASSQLSASTADQRGYRASALMQFWTLLRRAVLDNWRNPSLARAKIMQKIVMGLFVGLLYLNTPPGQMGIANINGALFYLVSEFTYPALFGILLFMPLDYALIVREHHNGMYSVGAYYVSKALSYGPLFSVDGIVLMMISYFMIGLRPAADAFLLALLIGVCIEQSSAACGVMLSTVAPSFPIAVSIAGPFLTLISLTGGLYANVGTLPVYISWMQYVSWFRYGFEALAVNQWHPIENITCTATDLTCLTTGDQVLASYSFDAAFLWRDIGLMIASTFVFYTIGYIGLAIRVYRSR